jgi:hypothetical protein
MVGRRAPRGYRAGFAHGLCRRRTVYRFSDGGNLCNGDLSPVERGGSQRLIYFPATDSGRRTAPTWRLNLLDSSRTPDVVQADRSILLVFNYLRL